MFHVRATPVWDRRSPECCFGSKSPELRPKARLAYFRLEPHPKMPQMALSRSAADDIATYIETLRK